MPATLPAILRVPRVEFLTRRWQYRPGEHVTFIAPTGNGKTTLANELLSVTASPELPALQLVMKPKDETAQEWGKALEFRRVSTWPPPPSVWRPRKPPGYLVWPKHQMYDPRATQARHAHIMGYAILDSYAKGNRILFADELYSLDAELGLGTELVTVWTKGRSMGTGLWGATQKPTHVPLWAYSQARHMFLSYDPDKRARDRYKEIAGMDPALIESGVSQLNEFEWVYVRLAGRQSTICIVGA